jgi:aerobic carbon-monoxide dehydrogenase large subunit
MAEHAGQVIRRREDPRLVTGAGQFIDDFRLPDCLHVAIVRSPHAHARLLSIDTAAAAKARGVVAVVTGADLGPANAPLPLFNEHPGLPRAFGIQPLATERVRFVGEPFAAVVATDRYLAQDAAELIGVDYAPLPAVADVAAAAAAGAPLVHEALGTNVAAEWRQQVGDPEKTFREAEVVVRATLRQARGGAQPLETRGLVARWADGQLTVWAAIQMVHRHRRFIARQLGLPEEQLRVIAPPDVGGGFGTKGQFYPEDILVPALARRLGRPVKWIEDRREHLAASWVERDQIHEIEVAATRDGRLLGLRDRFLHELGAYTVSGLNLPQNTMIHSLGPYRIPHVELAFRGVLTNTTPVGSYRGAGRPQGAFVAERAVDAVARELRLDPIEVRRRNLIPSSAHPYNTGLGTVGRGPVVYDSGNFPRCFELALEALDYAAVRREQARLKEQGRWLGVGVVNYIEATGTVPLESVAVRVGADGAITVVTGASPQGQGHVTMLSHLVGELLGVHPESIEVLTGDTSLIETGGGTFGSRTTALAGSAALLASRAVHDKARRIAAHLLEAAAEDVVGADGRFAVRGFPGRSVGWVDVAAAAHDGRVPDEVPGLEDTQVFTVSQSTFANGTHAAVIEVDPATGALRVLRWVVAHDCGRVLQPGLVDGQIHGGVVQGLPDALNDQLAYDGGGQRLTATLMDYALATAADAPPTFEIRHLESPTPLNPLGAKGAGEGGIMPVHPVIAQAVEDALALFDVRVTRVPVTRADIVAMVRGHVAELTVLSGGAVQTIVAELAEAYRAETGQAVQVTFATVGKLRKQAMTEPADVLILTDDAIDELMREGIVVAGTRTDIARVGVGVAVKQGAPCPDVSTVDALRQALLAAKSLVCADPAKGATSGVHFAEVLQRLGIADSVKAKTLLWPEGFPARAVAAGQAELCVHQISGIVPVPGVTLVGPLPRELQKITTYSAGLGTRSAHPAAARAFLAFLARPAFRARFAAAGMDYRE